MKGPTYRDIQKMTNLSLSTISRYFNGELLKASNVDCIEDAIRALGYKPQNTAAGAPLMKHGKTAVVGLLLPNLTHSPFYMQLCAALEQEFAKRGVSTLVCNYASGTEYDEKSIIQLLLNNHVCAIVAIPADIETLNLINLQNRNLPIVLLDKLSDTIKTDAVIVDNKAIAALAVDEFNYHHHQKIAIVTVGKGYTAKTRIEGYKEAMERYGLPIREEYMIDSYLTESGIRKELETLLSLEDRPTAVFCANQKALLECLYLIEEMGLQIPEDISVIGMDDLVVHKVTSPHISMILQPVENIASNAADIVLDKIGGARELQSYSTMELPVSLLRGESIAKL